MEGWNIMSKISMSMINFVRKQKSLVNRWFESSQWGGCLPILNHHFCYSVINCSLSANGTRRCVMEGSLEVNHPTDHKTGSRSGYSQSWQKRCKVSQVSSIIFICRFCYLQTSTLAAAHKTYTGPGWPKETWEFVSYDRQITASNVSTTLRKPCDSKWVRERERAQ